MNVQTAKSARVQDSLLAPLERPTLQWLVRRLPGWTTPDHLTLLGFAAMFLAGLCYALTGFSAMFYHAVNACLLVNWFGDSLDGTLARHTGRLRPRYGFYVDHMIDALGTLFLVAGMAWSGVMGERAAAALLTAYLLLSIHSYLASQTLGVFRISFFGFSPTELRILLAVGNLAAIVKPEVRIAGVAFRLFDVGAWSAAAAMVCVLAVSAIGTARKLRRLETPPILRQQPEATQARPNQGPNGKPGKVSAGGRFTRSHPAEIETGPRAGTSLPETGS